MGGRGARAAVVLIFAATLLAMPTSLSAGSATCFGEQATIMAVPGEVTLGTDGPDVIIGTSGDDEIRSGPGNDKICTKGGNDRVFAGAGDDKINLGKGNDLAKGGKGNDLIRGKSGRDRLFGNGGADILDGGSGNDRLKGGGGLDILKGKSGADVLRGGKGPDLCFGGKGSNSLFSCNEDLDRIVATAKATDKAASQGNGIAAWGGATFPIGEWTAADLSCFSFTQLGSITKKTMLPDPGWVVPDNGQPGAGVVPDGRIYSFKGSFGARRAHATVIGGAAYFFPSGCVTPANPGDSKNCGDFSTYAEAKAWFDLYFPFYGDVADLDANGDGIPCEGLPGAP